MTYRALRLQSAWAHDSLGTLAGVLLAPQLGEFRSRHITSWLPYILRRLKRILVITSVWVCYFWGKRCSNIWLTII